ncbi:hypothetical protein PSACC_02637 [Paramicrosporidium saccamoebae]|uniref:Uncharacterized protein n=1 Tax=Paramicrosporidium saccamoebae TaxID=1246581 RepID=A0A2H9TIE7_9FUNG|nr:hypothetical protein PSACC_02637 [Paramicrosporidium saccamoebae]
MSLVDEAEKVARDVEDTELGSLIIFEIAISAGRRHQGTLMIIFHGVASAVYQKHRTQYSAAWLLEISRIFFECQFPGESIKALEDALSASGLSDELRCICLENIASMSGMLPDGVEYIENALDSIWNCAIDLYNAGKHERCIAIASKALCLAKKCNDDEKRIMFASILMEAFAHCKYCDSDLIKAVEHALNDGKDFLDDIEMMRPLAPTKRMKAGGHSSAHRIRSSLESLIRVTEALLLILKGDQTYKSIVTSVRDRVLYIAKTNGIRIGEMDWAKKFCELSLSLCGRLIEGKQDYERQIRQGYAEIIANLN